MLLIVAFKFGFKMLGKWQQHDFGGLPKFPTERTG